MNTRRGFLAAIAAAFVAPKAGRLLWAPKPAPPLLFIRKPIRHCPGASLRVFSQYDVVQARFIHRFEVVYNGVRQPQRLRAAERRFDPARLPA